MPNNNWCVAHWWLMPCALLTYSAWDIFDSVCMYVWQYETNTKLVRNASTRDMRARVRVLYLIHRSKSKCTYRIECNLSRMGEYHTRVRRYVIYRLPRGDDGEVMMCCCGCDEILFCAWHSYVIWQYVLCTHFIHGAINILDARTIWENKKERKWRIKSNTELTAPIKPQHTHIIS